MIRKIVPIIISVALTCTLHAQVVIDGTVSDNESNEIIRDVIVKIIEPDSMKSIISYTISDKKGYYRLRFQTKLPNVDIEFSFLGFKTVTRRIPVKTTTLNQALSFSPINLKELTVKAPDISSQNDTINYNVSAFISKADRNVEDILRKLPGITVQENGQIEYQGKSINKFYIEGLDMLEGRYNLATKNISANQITTVQVYENHQPVRLLKGVDFSDRAALNITLKDKKMTRPVGNILAGGGYDSHPLYRGELFGFMANNKRQFLLSAKGNNSGADLQSETTLFYNSNERRIKAGDYIEAIPFSVPGFIIPRTKKASDFSAALNTLRKINESTNIKLNLVYSRRNREYLRESTSSYFTGEDAITIHENMQSYGFNNNVAGTAVYEMNADSIFIKNSLNTRYTFGSKHTDLSSSPDAYQDYSLQQVLLSNDLSLMWRRGKNTFFLQSLISGGLMPDNELLVLDNNFSSPILQKNSGSMLYTQTTTAFVKSFNAFSNLRINLQLETEYDKINSKLNNLHEGIQSENDNHGYKVFTTVTPSYNFNRNRFSFSLNLPIQYINISYDDDILNSTFKFSKPYLNPEANIRYAFSPAFSLSARSGFRHSTGDILSFIMHPIQKSHNKVFYGESGILSHNQSKSASLRYDYRHAMNGLFSSLSVMYNRSKKNILRGSNVSDDGLVTSMGTGTKNYANMFSSNFYVAKNMHNIKTTFALNAGYTYSKNQGIRQDKPISYSSNLASLYPSINFRSIKWLSLRAQGSISILSQKINDVSNSSSSITNWGVNIDFSVLPMDNIEIYYLLDYRNNPTSLNMREQVYFMDAGFRYQPKRHIELEATFKNITNINIYSNINYVDTDMFITSFQLRPFSIMFSFKYSF